MVPLDYLSIFNSETKEKLIGLCLNRKLIESFNPFTSPGEGVTVFTSPYLSAGAPALGEAKGLIKFHIFIFFYFFFFIHSFFIFIKALI